MSTVNPLAPSLASGSNGEAQQQRWLQDMERAWLRSWQQAAPTPAAAAEQAAPAPTPLRGDTAAPAAAAHGSVGTSGLSAPSVVPAVGDAMQVSAPRVVMGAAGSVHRGATEPAAEATGRSLPAPVLAPSTIPTPQAGLSSTSAPSRTPFPMHAAQTPRSATPMSLHLREPATDSVVAALRDSRLDPVASRAAADALARQLALAGYAQVQVYVNGAALQRQSAAPLQPESVQQENPPHGH